MYHICICLNNTCALVFKDEIFPCDTLLLLLLFFDFTTWEVKFLFGADTKGEL